MVLTLLYPPANIPRVLFPPPKHCELSSLTPVAKLPKSVASPVDEIVTKSILSVTPGVAPPANTPRVEDEADAALRLDCVQSPKFTAFPCDVKST